MWGESNGPPSTTFFQPDGHLHPSTPTGATDSSIQLKPLAFHSLNLGHVAGSCPQPSDRGLFHRVTHNRSTKGVNTAQPYDEEHRATGTC